MSGVDRPGDPTREELRTRADRLSAELERVSASWHQGQVPSAEELYALVDELAAIRALLGRLAPGIEDPVPGSLAPSGPDPAEPLAG